MKKFTKVLFACAAVAAMTVAAGTAAMAEEIKGIQYNVVEDGADTITIPAYTSTGEQQTLLVLNNDATTVVDTDIVQIDQQGGAFADVVVGDLKDGTYYVRIGGDSAATFSYGTFTVGETVTPSTRKVGDVDGNTVINGTDAAKIVNHVLKSETLTGEALSAADTDTNGAVNGTDAAQIVNFVLKTTSTVDGVTTIK